MKIGKNLFSFSRLPGYLLLMAVLILISSICYGDDSLFELSPFFVAMTKRQHENALEILQSRDLKDWGDDLPPMNRSLSKGQRALHLAAQFGKTDLCLQIIRYGGLVNQKDNFGNTPLHLAAKYGHSETIAVLALKGASIDVQNGRKMTPLHFASQYANPEAIKSLIRLGADPESMNDEGKTCFDLAETAEASAALETVEELLADPELTAKAKKQKLIDLMIKRSIPVP